MVELIQIWEFSVQKQSLKFFSGTGAQMDWEKLHFTTSFITRMRNNPLATLYLATVASRICYKIIDSSIFRSKFVDYQPMICVEKLNFFFSFMSICKSSLIIVLWFYQKFQAYNITLILATCQRILHDSYQSQLHSVIYQIITNRQTW